MILDAVLFRCDRCRASETTEDAKDWPDGWALVTITHNPDRREAHLCDSCSQDLSTWMALR